MGTTSQNSIEETIRYIDENNDMLWRQRGSSAQLLNIAKLGEEVYQKALTIDYKPGLAKAVLNRSMGIFILKNDAEAALAHLNQAFEIFESIGSKKWIANVHSTRAIILNTVGNKEAAVYNILKSLDYYENSPHEIDDFVMMYYVAGTIYKDLKKFEEAEAYYLKAVDWDAREKSNWSGRVLAGLATVYAESSEYEKALTYSFKSLERLRSEDNNIGESRALSDIGVIYKKQKNYTKALEYLQQALNIRIKENFKQFVITSYLEIASLHSETNNPQEAIVNLEKGMVYAMEIKQIAKLVRIYADLANNYKRIGDFEKATFYLEKQLDVTTEVNKAEVDNRINNLHNTLVKEKEEEIERLRNVELKNAYHLISEKNKEITDSINYARRIQQGILPSPADLTNTLKEHFVLYKPKDIVSGDFYWCKKVNPAGTDLNVGAIAVIDCTGHGVPGAFMSMLGQTLLNQSGKSGEVTSPADALNYLNKELPKNLKSQDKQQSIKDGMDCTLVAIEFNSRFLLYAGANNPLWIVRNNELIELAPEKQAISASDEIEKRPFKNTEFLLKANDMVYLFTDGYADQFGGPKGKKFKYSNLKDLLIRISGMNMDDQKQNLETEFENWRGNLEQVDDVLIIGIRIT